MKSTVEDDLLKFPIGAFAKRDQYPDTELKEPITIILEHS